MTKPFTVEELLARVRGMFRRQEWYQGPGPLTEHYRFAGGEINFRTLQAVVGEKPGG